MLKSKVSIPVVSVTVSLVLLLLFVVFSSHSYYARCKFTFGFKHRMILFRSRT